MKDAKSRGRQGKFMSHNPGLKQFCNSCDPISIYHRAREYIRDEFWRLNQERDDQGMYELLKDLSFELGRKDVNGNYPKIDEQYRINGNAENGWQYAYFQQDLSNYLPSYLIKKGLLTKSADTEGRVAIQIDGKGPSFIKHAVKPRPSGRGCKASIFPYSTRRLLLLNVSLNNFDGSTAATTSKITWRP